MPSPLVRQWELERAGPVRQLTRAAWGAVRRPVRALAVAGISFLLGTQVAAGPDSALANLALRERLLTAESSLKGRQGELELIRLELKRLTMVADYSARYRIPADMSAAIYDAARAEGIDPQVGYSLVRVESGFHPRAVSHKGAVGLAQLMPATAFELDPSLSYAQLFDRDTNLRLGFRYLRLMLAKYDGDLRLALLAYNRGPGTVDAIRREGGDPANGYARAVMRGF
jgi:soluble lytic murein transglycosylase-like protein